MTPPVDPMREAREAFERLSMWAHKARDGWTFPMEKSDAIAICAAWTAALALRDDGWREIESAIIAERDACATVADQAMTEAIASKRGDLQLQAARIRDAILSRPLPPPPTRESGE